MKRFAYFAFIFLSIISSAQENKTGIPIPMKAGIVFYEMAIGVNKTIPSQKFLANATKWLNTSFPGSKEKVTIDKKTNTITSNIEFKVITDEVAGHYYWIKPLLTIQLRNDSCVLQLYNYYEKPIMPGVTNDYSKIEYRWWDFRKGKPWNKEDDALFHGLDNKSEELEKSFGDFMQKL
ncbi:MAG: hypothetical protein QM764_02570 [Chitinophagaceae bacterium]